MGLSSEMFLDEVSEQLLCSVCLEVMNDPVVLQPCQHYFCKHCILTVIDNDKHCPIDRGTINESSINRPAPIILSIIDNLKMKCKFSPECEEIILYKDAGQHELECRYNPLNNVTCEDCSKPLTLTTKPTHDCKLQIQKEIENLTSQTTKLQAQVKRTEMEKFLLKNEHSELKAEKQKLEKKISSLEATNQSSLWQIQNLEREIRNLESRNRDLEYDKSHLKSQISNLENKVSSLESQSRDSRW